MSLERQINTLRKDKQEMQKRNDSTVGELHAVESERDAIRMELYQSKAKLHSLESSVSGEASQVKGLQRDKLRLIDLNGKQQLEIDRLSGELNKFLEKELKLSHRTAELEDQLSEAHSELIPVRFQIEKLTQEKTLIQKHSEWLNSELESKSDALLRVRKQQSARILELQEKLDRAQNDAATSGRRVTELQSALAESETRINEQSNEIRELRANQASEGETANQELAIQKQYVNLYKKSRDDFEAKCKALDAQLTKLQALFEEQNKTLKEVEAQKRELEKNITQSSTETESLRERCALLEAELAEEREKVRLAIEAVKEPSGSEASSSKDDGYRKSLPSVVPLSDEGPTSSTASEIFRRYVEACDKLKEAEDKNRKLLNEQHSILREIQVKAPIIQRERQENQRLVKEHHLLSERLSTLSREYEALRETMEREQYAKDELEKFNHVLEQDKNDLTRQLRNLLRKQALALQEGNASFREIDLDDNSMLDSSDVISEHLVLFNNVDELQMQNERLRHVVRELSEKEDQRGEDSGMKVDVDSREVQELRKQVADLTERRRDDEERFKVMTQQFEAFKSMLRSETERAEEKNSSFAPSSVFGSSSGPSRAGNSNAPIPAALTELQQQFDLYKRDKATNESSLRESLDEAKEELSTKRVEAAKLSAELKYLKDRFEATQEQLSSQKQDAKELAEQNSKYSGHILRLEAQLNDVNIEKNAANDNLARVRRELAKVQSELKIAQANDARLAEENSRLGESTKRQERLLASLQKMEFAFTNKDEETRKQLAAQKTELQNQLFELKRSSESERRELQDELRVKESATQEMRSRVEKLQSQFHETKESLIKAQCDLSAEKERSKDMAAQLTKSQAQVEALLEKRLASEADLSDDRFTTLTKQQELEAEVEKLKGELEAANNEITTKTQQVTDIQNIATQHEAALATLTKTAEEMKRRSDTTVKALSDSKAEIEKRLEEVSGRMLQHDKERDQEIEAFNTTRRELSEKLSAAEAARADAVSKADLMKTAIDGIKQNLLNQREQTEEALNNYRRELSQHAASEERYMKAKAKLTDVESALNAKTLEASRLAQELEDGRTEWTSTQTKLTEEIAKLEARVKDSSHQNNLLLSQLETVTMRSRQIQEQYGNISLSSISGIATVSSGSSETGGDVQSHAAVQQAHQLVSLLRREKEQVQQELDVKSDEAVSLSHRLQYAERKLDEVKQQLEDALSSNASGASSNVALSSDEHKSLVSTMEQVNLLRESNSMLRASAEKSEGKVASLESQIAVLQSETEPLRQQVKQLSEELSAIRDDNGHLRDENVRWKKRNQQLLDKYQQVDPVIHDELVKAHGSLLAETELLREQLVELAMLRETISKLESTLSKKEETLQNNNQTLDKMRTAARNWKDRFDKKKAEEDTYKSTIQKLEGQLLEKQSSDASVSSSVTAGLRRQIMATRRAQNEAKTVADKLEKAIKLLRSKSERIEELENELAASEEALSQVKDSFMMTQKTLSNIQSRNTELTSSFETQYSGLLEQYETRQDDLKKEYDEKVSELEAQHKEATDALQSTNQAQKAQLRELNKRLSSRGEESKQSAVTSAPTRQKRGRDEESSNEEKEQDSTVSLKKQKEEQSTPISAVEEEKESSQITSSSSSLMSTSSGEIASPFHSFKKSVPRVQKTFSIKPSSSSPTAADSSSSSAFLAMTPPPANAAPGVRSKPLFPVKNLVLGEGGGSSSGSRADSFFGKNAAASSSSEMETEESTGAMEIENDEESAGNVAEDDQEEENQGESDMVGDEEQEAPADNDGDAMEAEPEAEAEAEADHEMEAEGDVDTIEADVDAEVEADGDADVDADGGDGDAEVEEPAEDAEADAEAEAAPEVDEGDIEADGEEVEVEQSEADGDNENEVEADGDIDAEAGADGEQEEEAVEEAVDQEVEGQDEEAPAEDAEADVDAAEGQPEEEEVDFLN